MANTEQGLQHVAAPGFAAGIATGVTIHGPTPDGNFHLTFFFDTARPERIPDGPSKGPGASRVQVEQGSHLREGFTIVRNNIATISMRPDQLEAMGKAIVELSDLRAKAKTESPEQGVGNVSA